MEMARSIGRDTRSPLATRLTYEGSTFSLWATRLNTPRHIACALVPSKCLLVSFRFILLLLSALLSAHTVLYRSLEGQSGLSHKNALFLFEHLSNLKGVS